MKRLFKSARKDKIIISKTKKCPPHCMGHKHLFTKPITNEPCHIHKKRLNMLHHIPFCWIFCKHYRFMIKSYKKYKNNKK